MNAKDFMNWVEKQGKFEGSSEKFLWCNHKWGLTVYRLRKSKEIDICIYRRNQSCSPSPIDWWLLHSDDRSSIPWSTMNEEVPEYILEKAKFYYKMRKLL